MSYCSWTGIHYGGMAVIDCCEKAVRGDPYCRRHKAARDARNKREAEERLEYETRLRAEGAAGALASLSCDECGTTERKTKLVLCGKCCRVSDEESKAEGAAEERIRHQAGCERALLEMEESATRRERKACAKLVMFAREVAAAILARRGKSCGRDSCSEHWPGHTKKCWAARGGKP